MQPISLVEWVLKTVVEFHTEAVEIENFLLPNLPGIL